jgi:hypothetical protein
MMLLSPGEIFVACDGSTDVTNDPRHRVESWSRRERQDPGGSFVQHRAQREDIGAGVERRCRERPFGDMYGTVPIRCPVASEGIGGRGIVQARST